MLALLNFVPEILGALGVNANTKKTADVVTDVAKTILGVDTEQEALDILAKDPAKLAEFKIAMGDVAKTKFGLVFADKKSARKFSNDNKHMLYIISAFILGGFILSIGGSAYIYLNTHNIFPDGRLSEPMAIFIGSINTFFIERCKSLITLWTGKDIKNNK